MKNSNLTVKDLIEFLQKKPSDSNIVFSVGDNYSTYGESAKIMSLDGFFHPFNKDSNQLTLKLNLESKKPFNDGEVEKYPKITFRK